MIFQKIKTPWNKGLSKETHPSLMIISNKNKKLNGKYNPFFGRQHTEETKRKISESKKKLYKEHPEKNIFNTNNPAKRPEIKTKLRESWQRRFNNGSFNRKGSLHKKPSKLKISETRRKLLKEGKIKTWNKGLTKEDPRVLKYTEKIIEHYKKYGYPSKLAKIHSIFMKTLFREHPEKHPNHNMKRISKPQRLLFSMVKKDFPNTILNQRIQTKKTGRWLDISIPELKIDIEYDEPYWHQNKMKDDQRDKELKEIGWKIIRFDKLIEREKVKEKIEKTIKEMEI